MEYSTGYVVRYIGVPNRTIQNWVSRYPDLIECSGGGKPGSYRVFPLGTLVQFRIAIRLLQAGFTNIRSILSVGKVVNEFRVSYGAEKGFEYLMVLRHNRVSVRKFERDKAPSASLIAQTGGTFVMNVTTIMLWDDKGEPVRLESHDWYGVRDINSHRYVEPMSNPDEWFNLRWGARSIV